MITIVSFQDRNRWYVHGITIDYCASGDTLEEAMVHFWAGLAMSFWRTQIEKGSVESLMNPPPREVIERLERLMGRSISSLIQSSQAFQ